MDILIGASLREPHIDGKCMRDPYIIYRGTSVILIARPLYSHLYPSAHTITITHMHMRLEFTATCLLGRACTQCTGPHAILRAVNSASGKSTAMDACRKLHYYKAKVYTECSSPPQGALRKTEASMKLTATGGLHF